MSQSRNIIKIDDSFVPYDPDHFLVSKVYRPMLESVLLPNGLIKDRVKRIASEVLKHYETRDIREIHLLCILTGACYFFADLLNELTIARDQQGIELEIYIQNVCLQSYVDDQSTGQVRLLGADCSAFADGSHIMVVEDIIDTGRTMAKLLSHVKSLGASSVTVASLLVKRTPLSTGYKPDFGGFEIPDLFVIGYGLDYNQHFRTLPHICVINDHCRESLSKKPTTETS